MHAHTYTNGYANVNRQTHTQAQAITFSLLWLENKCLGLHPGCIPTGVSIFSLIGDLHLCICLAIKRSCMEQSHHLVAFNIITHPQKSCQKLLSWKTNINDMELQLKIGEFHWGQTKNDSLNAHLVLKTRCLQKQEAKTDYLAWPRSLWTDQATIADAVGLDFWNWQQCPDLLFNWNVCLLCGTSWQEVHTVQR